MKKSTLIVAPLLISLAGCTSTPSSKTIEFGARYVEFFTADSCSPVDPSKIPHIVSFLRGVAVPNCPKIGFDHAAMVDVLDFLDTQTHDTRFGLSLGPPLSNWPYGDWIHQLPRLDDHVSLELRDISMLELWFQMSMRTGYPLLVTMRRIQYDEINGKKVDEVRPYLMLVDRATCGSIEGEAYFINFSPKKYLDHVKEGYRCGVQQTPSGDALKAAPEE